MFGGREHTSQKGLSATTAVLKRLVEKGYECLIFVHQAPNGEMRLRLKKSRNNQEQNVHWAKHYEL